MEFIRGQRVRHPEYGLGTVTDVQVSTATGSINLSVKFDTGGPIGWAERSNHDIDELAPEESS